VIKPKFSNELSLTIPDSVSCLIGTTDFRQRIRSACRQSNPRDVKKCRKGDNEKVAAVHDDAYVERKKKY